ncbi:MAG: hypothetical protein QM817_30105 [Archangium sp.]
MSAPTDAEARALVLQQFIALRRSGISSLDAVNRLVDALPEGAARAGCKEAALLLQAPTTAEVTDDFVRVLASRDDDVKRAEHLARSFEASLELEQARIAGRRVLQVGLAGPFVLLALVGLFAGNGQALAQLAGTLPMPTQLLYELASVMRIIGIPLAIFAVLLFSRLRVPVYGAGSLEAARGLFGAATQAAPLERLRTFKLGEAERGLLVALSKRHAPAETPVVTANLAARLMLEGRRRVETYRVFASLALAAAGVLSVGVVLIALYLPIFSIAGNVK